MVSLKLPKLDIVQRTKDLLIGSSREALSKLLPGGQIALEPILKVLNQSQEKILGDKQDATSVDQAESNAVHRKIDIELGGSYSPVTFVLNMLRSLFSNTRQNRVLGHLSVLKRYSELYDNFKVANENIEYLESKIHQAISKKEGMLSKFGMASQKRIQKVLADPVISSLISTLIAWKTPFYQILNGGVENTHLYKADEEFIKSVTRRLKYGKHSEYLQTAAAEYEKLGQSIERQRRKQENTRQIANQAQAAGQNPNSLSKSSPSQTRNPRALAQRMAQMAT